MTNYGEILISSLKSFLERNPVQERYDFANLQNEENPKPKTVSKPKQTKPVKDNLRKLITAIHLKQYRESLMPIYKLAGFYDATGSRTKEEAVQKGLIKMVSTLGKKYPILTEKAYEDFNLSKGKTYFKGAGPEHIIHQNLTADHLSEYKPQIELNRNGKFIDVAIPDYKGKLIGFEICITTAKSEGINLQKNFDAGTDFCFILCKNQKVLQEVGKIFIKLPENIKRKTRAFLISKFLEMDPKEILQLVI